MKRDMTLIRRILRCLRARDDDSDTGYTEAPDFLPEVSERRVRYHLDLCVGAGYLEHRPAKDAPGGRPALPAWRLTWKGHDWLESQSDC